MGDSGYAYSNIDTLFHAPARLSVAAALYAHRDGLTFTELKSACRLSDGNLSRHIARMEQDQAVTTVKSFVKRVPRTTVLLTSRGRDRFESYIETLRAIVDAQTLTRSPREVALQNGAIHE